jgi:signal transduction histidine kinase/CheY-like chemotaxis protein/streptogramin lyase
MRRTMCRTRALLLCAAAALFACHAVPGLATARFRHLTMEDGLSNNEVNIVIQDSKGYVWLGTIDGLDRYDGYTFRIFRHDPNDVGSISGNFIRALYEDPEGRLWAGTFSNGLNLYDPDTGTFKHYRHIPGDPDSIISDSIWSLGPGPDGTLLIGTWDAGLDVFDPKTGKFRHFPAGSGPAAPGNNRINDILVDSQQRVWLATLNGLDLFDPSGKAPARHFRADDSSEANNIWRIAEDAQHRLWLATHAGPYMYVPGEAKLRQVPGAPNEHYPGSEDLLDSVRVDRQQNVWYGSINTGLYLIRAGTGHVRRYQQDIGNTDSLSSNTVLSIFQDRAGFIWVATDAGVSLLDPNVLDVYSLRPSDINGVKLGISDKVHALYEYQGKLLLGAPGTIYQFPLASQDDSLKDASNVFMHLDLNRYGMVRAIAGMGARGLLVTTELGYLISVDSQGHVLKSWRPGEDVDIRPRAPDRIVMHGDHQAYLATFGNGLLDFDLSTSRTRQIAGTTPSELSSNDIVEDLLQATPRTLWAGTFRGLFQVDAATGKSTLVPMTPGNIEPVVQGLYLDPQHVLWIGTYDGLWRLKLDAAGNPLARPEAIPQFHRIQVLGIEQDPQGFLWLASVNSLMRFDPKSGTVLTFGRDQGSPITEYYSYGHTRTSNGWLWFGGGQGAVGFLSKDLKPNLQPPGVVLNGVTAYREGKPVHLPILPGAHLTLSYRDAISIFDVAATDFGAPQANNYSYRLLGFQPDWTPPSPSHQITFTNLNPGHYRLEVRATNNWGTLSTVPATLDIVVLPPWWRTWWAYTIYLLIIIGSSIAYVYSLKRKIVREKAVSAELREANELKSHFVERLEVQVKEATLELRETLQGVNLKNAELEIAQRRAAEGEQVKSQFLANMSHELRTPLTGVLGYTKLLTSTPLTSEQKDYVSTIRVSSESLLAIINDTLDLSRLEAGKLLIDEVDFDLLELIESTLELLAPIAYQKRLELVRVIPPEVPLQLRGDPLRMRQVLTNLLSNSIKFTESGAVCIEVKQVAHGDRDTTLSFSVSDTGIGIPENEIGQLFNAYARGRISTRHQVEGTGLGLAICKKLLDLMGGSIGVKSRVGTGSTFEFQLKFRLQKHATPGTRLPRKLSILLYDKHPLSSAAWRASLTRLGADVREVRELESLMSMQAEAAVLSLSERELAHLGELKQKFSPALPPMLILAPRIERQALKDLSEALYHRVLSKTAREKTVYLELQSLVQAAVEPSVRAADASKQPPAAPAPDAPLVLVADDNRINRRLLVTMLNQSGFRTAEAGNGLELLDLAARGPWQAALLDIHMPRMDGIETATKLRATYGDAVPPIIAMSADVLPEGKGQAQQGLMDGFLMKPFNEQQLVDLLRQHMDRHARKRRAAG